MHLIKEFELAKHALDNSQVISFPTETVMGLGVYYDDEKAYHLLNQIKRRPEDKPYTLMLGDVKQINKYAFVNERDAKIIDSFMPGMITVLLKAKANIPDYVTHNSGIIGIRIPNMPEIIELLNCVKKPLLVPSANRSGQKPCMSSNEVKKEFKDELGYILPGEAIGGVPSTIVDLTGEEVKILREGPISKEEIISALKGGN